jgi:hypothetical protein
LVAVGGNGVAPERWFLRLIPAPPLVAAEPLGVQQHRARFILILNSDQLADRKLWEPNVEDRGKKVEELDEAGRLRAKWRMQLQELGIHACDEYEELVVEFLKSGLFDVADVEKVIER